MKTDNSQKRKPKTDIKFNLTLDADQKEAKKIILERPINIVLGKPGTGKTLLSVQIALDLLFNRKINKIVITRPTISTEDNGFLPGTIEEKMDPWIVPLRDNMFKLCGEDKIKTLEVKRDIEIVPLSYFRGRTFERAVCVVDEFENLTEEQFEMCLGRLGKESIMIFCGDFGQCDLKKTKNPFQIMNAILTSNQVNKIELRVNHRHPVLEELFNILDQYKNGN